MDITTTQAAASKQVETFFKFILLLCCGDIALLRRFSLEIRYNLELMNMNGGNVTTIQIIPATPRVITLTIIKVVNAVLKMSDIAKSVSSLRLVTDVL